MYKKLTKRVLLIGWDAADWKVIHPLMDAGKMPALKWLVENGAAGNLASLDPPMSPIMWTSIGTGKTADKHGVLGFIQPRADAKGVQPVLGTSRKTKALWNILMQNDLRCHVIGWWPSHPAERLNGVSISNFYHRATAELGKPWPLAPGSVHPQKYEDVLAWLRVHPQELTAQHILPFVPDAAKIDPEKTDEPAAKMLSSLAKITAEAATVHSAATWVMDHEEWDFMAVYFDAVDHYSHGFMKFHPPHREGIPKDLYDYFNGVVEGGYRFHDMMLRHLIQRAGPDTTIILCSDHGFHPDHLRPLGIPDEPAGPAAEHRHHGIVAMAGPGIAKDSLIYGACLLDITPTILSLYGLPLGRDMDGKPLTQAFSEIVEPEYIDSWDEVAGDSGMAPEEQRRDPWAEQEAMNQLVELGYVEKPDDNAEKAIENCERESNFYLARVYLHKHDYESARPLLEDLHRRYPDQYRFGLRLADLYMTLDRGADARRVVEEILEALDNIAEAHEDEKERAKAKRKLDRSGPNIQMLLGRVALAEGNTEEALAHFERVQMASPRYIGLANELGRTYYKMRRWADAEEAYFKALDADPHNAAACHGLAAVYLEMRLFQEAAEAALESIGLLYHNPFAHFHLGEALFRMGEFEEAERAWLTCVQQAPGMVRAHKKLIALYERHLRAPLKAQEHQTFIDEKIRDHREKTEIQDTTLDKSLPAPLYERGGSWPPPEQIITIVSGLPRSGTSMMMQMLSAGGMAALTDDTRMADDSNPKGYWEYAKTKALARDNSWLDDARGKVVKVIAQLLPWLPNDQHYRIIFMQRDLREVLQSQDSMLSRLERQSADPERLAETYQRQLEAVDKQLTRRPNADVLYVPHRAVLENPLQQAQRLAEFQSDAHDVADMRDQQGHGDNQQGFSWQWEHHQRQYRRA
jgi:predicted AlkP superfamily phosphohydrolase/phosphomutase/tetratricopeptide (TPR) repeat protein